MRQMVEILTGLEGTMAYMDDILVHGKDEAEHETRLTGVLKVLRAAGLKLNEDKVIMEKRK